jgi:transposase
MSPDAVNVCEATGGYERKMLRAFEKAQYRTCVVQPYRVRQFAEAMGCLAKTDKIDAQIIARFADACKPLESSKTTAAQDRLRALVSLERQIKLQITAMENQISLVEDPVVKASATRLLKAHKNEIQRIEKALSALVKDEPELASKVEKLTAFQGVGKTTAFAVLAYAPELGTLSRGQISALAGLAPYNRDSGTLKGKRSIRGGRAELRTALYMASLTASRSNPVLSEVYERLRAAGKPAKVALTALMRKLLIALNACLAKPDFQLALTSPVAPQTAS